MKSWMRARFIMGAATSLSGAFLDAALSGKAELNGATKNPPLKEVAYNYAGTYFGDAIGMYYGKKYLGPEARADVERMIREEIAVYKTRLERNDWLDASTRETAIRKLDTITVRAGYPDKLPPEYALYKVDPSLSLYENAAALGRADVKYNFSLYGTVPDNTRWITSAHVVNAFYSPSDNSVNIPAGILRDPFYSRSKSRSWNMGSIGAMIGHEISHAFDSNGSLFDENGDKRNWWTETDRAEFKKRTGEMASLFDGREFMGGRVNGRLTVTENTADAGGLSCVLELVPLGERREFFEGYATSWRERARPEIERLFLVSDPHAPDKMRVNVQLSNCGAFYETYKISPGDGMWLSPEKRVLIW
jgi:putative endopeptidase